MYARSTSPGSVRSRTSRLSARSTAERADRRFLATSRRIRCASVTRSILRPTPVAPVAREQRVRLGRTPGPGAIRQRRRRRSPRLEQRLGEGPTGLDAVIPDEERVVASERVKQQPLVGIRAIPPRTTARTGSPCSPTEAAWRGRAPWRRSAALSPRRAECVGRVWTARARRWRSPRTAGAGAGLNTTATSVTRFGSRLPWRR